jgi:BirA family transcriptional regulator, biotin operon repressor / biotin---[acetyl-CoA-carboxylase] ligase
VLVEERKVTGILVERVETPAGPAAVVGIGLNVSTTAEELPVPTATSLALEGSAPDRTDLLLALLSALDREYRAWPTAGPGLRERYVAACATLGRAVRVELPGGVLEGTATDVDADGRLVVDGTPLSAGDVVHVRSATT